MLNIRHMIPLNAASVSLAGLMLGVSVVSLSAEEVAGVVAPAVADFRLKTLDGETVSLHESLAKGPVLISFWATWCKPCRQEMPHLDEINAAWRERGLSTYAISIDKPRSQANVRTYVRSHGFAFDVLLDPNSSAFRKLQGQSVPYTVLLDRTGEAVYVKSGYRPGDERELADAVGALFAATSESTDESASGTTGAD